MIHSFLLIGQSNMAGRGFLTEAPLLDNRHLLVLRNGRWVPAFRPIHTDRSFAGACLAESFGLCYAAAHGVDVGLIPCADGGTCLDQWAEGSLLYDNAVYQGRLALRTSEIAGILWHQGEADCRADRCGVYGEKLRAMLTALRRDLHLEDVPVVLGGLGDYFRDGTFPDIARYYRDINRQLDETAHILPRTGYVPAEGLEPNPDRLHFSARALAEFGQRYADVFRTLEDPNRVFTEKSDADGALRGPMERL